MYILNVIYLAKHAHTYSDHRCGPRTERDLAIDVSLAIRVKIAARKQSYKGLHGGEMESSLPPLGHRVSPRLSAKASFASMKTCRLHLTHQSGAVGYFHLTDKKKPPPLRRTAKSRPPRKIARGKKTAEIRDRISG